MCAKACVWLMLGHLAPSSRPRLDSLPAAPLSVQGEQGGMIMNYLRLEVGRDRLEVGLGKGGCVMYSKERDRGGRGAQS